MTNTFFSRSQKSLLKVFLIQLTAVLIWLFSTVPMLSYGNYPPATDTAIYHLVGRGLFDGLLPYRDLFDHKGPLTYLLHGLGSLITPHSTCGTGILLAIFISVGLLYAYRTFRLYFSSIVSILLSLWLLPFIRTEGATPDTLAIPFYLIPLFYYLRQQKFQEARIPWIGLGVCTACLLLLKFNLVAFCIPVTLTLLWNELSRNRYAALFSALWRLGLGLFVPILLFVGFFSLYRDGLSSLWDCYILFCLKYANSREACWLATPILVWSQFFPEFEQAREFGIPCLIILPFSIISILGGFIALLWRPFRSMLFPQREWSASATLMLCFVLIFFSSFSAAWAINYYYIAFMPFYALTLTAITFLLSRRYSDITTVIILGLTFTLIFSCRVFSCVKKISGYTDTSMNMFVRKHPNDSLIIYPADFGYLNLYMLSETHPVIRIFYSPNLVHLNVEDDIMMAIEEKRCVYFLHLAYKPLSRSIQEVLSRNYQHISDATATGKWGNSCNVHIYKRM